MEQDIIEAKNHIKKQNKEWLMEFLIGCAMQGILRVDYGLKKKPTQTLRKMAYQAVDNLAEGIKNGEIKNKVKDDSPSELILKDTTIANPNVGRIRFVGDK